MPLRFKPRSHSRSLLISRSCGAAATLSSGAQRHRRPSTGRSPQRKAFIGVRFAQFICAFGADYPPALRATSFPKEAFIGSASRIFYAGGAGANLRAITKWVGLIRVGLLFMPRAARAPSSDPFGATFFPKKAYNRNRARRAHLLKPSAVSCQPSAGASAERGRLTSDSLIVSASNVAH